jgi:hypothetical protein
VGSIGSIGGSGAGVGAATGVGGVGGMGGVGVCAAATPENVMTAAQAARIFGRDIGLLILLKDWLKPRS